MFERLKNVFTKEKSLEREDSASALAAKHEADEITSHDWIEAHAAFFKSAAGATNFSMKGVLGNKSWKLERAAAPRNYIVGEELRVRADIDVDAQVTVLVMNRALKELLENRAYALYTDTLETEASPALMEEMRWLALYPEVGWEELPHAFWRRYAVMTSRRPDAHKWLTPEIVDLLTEWPEPAPGADVPFMLMLMRGKTHLRMQWGRADEHLMAHAVQLLISASNGATASFPRQPAVLTKE
jgi:hypothetical protein